MYIVKDVSHARVDFYLKNQDSRFWYIKKTNVKLDGWLLILSDFSHILQKKKCVESITSVFH